MRFPVYLIDKDLEVRKGLFHVGEGVFEEKELDFRVDGIKRVVMPSFFNSHVHLMDSVVLAPKMPLEDLVGPGGYKFRVLSSAKESEIVEVNKQAISFAISQGTTGFADFREMGMKGLKILRKADGLRAVIPLSRPESLEEAEDIIKEAFVKGFGMSSIRDHEYSFLEELRELAKKNGLFFGIHAGERDDVDVEGAIALEPDFLVHMNRSSAKNLKVVLDNGIPVISCIRSNFFFGLENLRNYSILAECENWGIGTDNVMIATPSLLDEINFASYFLPSKDLFRAAFFGFGFFEAEQRWIMLECFKEISNPIEEVARGFCKVINLFDRIVE